MIRDIDSDPLDRRRFPTHIVAHRSQGEQPDAQFAAAKKLAHKVILRPG